MPIFPFYLTTVRKFQGWGEARERKEPNIYGDHDDVRGTNGIQTVYFFCRNGKKIMLSCSSSGSGNNMCQWHEKGGGF